MVNYANKQHTFGELRLVLAPLAHVLVAENVHHFADNILSRAQIVSNVSPKCNDHNTKLTGIG